MKDHDIKLRDNVIAKVDGNTARPHADGCVGCRREGVCIKCGKPSAIANGRCVSGACSKCCKSIHKHVDDNPLAVTVRLEPL